MGKRQTAMLVIGLHITKCAGTTLANHIQSRMPPKGWYFCSAFRDMQAQAMLEFPERTTYDALRFVFGHFVHELLFSAFANRDIFLFTGVRSPVDRAVSEYFHICRVRERANLPAIDADQFFAMRKNTMCVEILRAFPSLAHEVSGSLADKAIAVCAMFDLIYDTRTFSDSVGKLLKLLRVDAAEMRDVNVRSTEMAERLAESESSIRDRAPQYFEQDEKLFAFLAPHLGKMRPFRENGATKLSAYRGEWEFKLRMRANGYETFARHLAGYLVADYRNLGLLPELEELLGRKERWIATLRGLT